MFRKRNLKLVRTVMRSPKRILHNYFMRQLVENENKESFGQEYIQAIAVRKEGLERRNLKLSIFNILLISILFTHIVSDVKEITLFGISSKDIDEIKEIILVVSATANLFIGWFSFAEGQLETVINAWLEKHYADKTTREFHSLTFPGLLGKMSSTGLFSKSDPYGPWGLTVLFHVIGFFIAIFLTFVPLSLILFVHGFVIWDIAYSSPLPSIWIILIVSYAIATNITYLFLSIVLRIPLPHKDFTVVNELTQIRKQEGEEAWKQKIAELLNSDSHK